MVPFVDVESGELLVDRIVDSIQDEQPIHDNKFNKEYSTLWNYLSHITQSFTRTDILIALCTAGYPTSMVWCTCSDQPQLTHPLVGGCRMSSFFKFKSKWRLGDFCLLCRRTIGVPIFQYFSMRLFTFWCSS